MDHMDLPKKESPSMIPKKTVKAKTNCFKTYAGRLKDVS
jgi:hypothetical protein